MEINPFGATVSVDKTTIWDVLTQLYELYSVRWSIEEDNGQISIKVGTTRGKSSTSSTMATYLYGRNERGRDRTGFDPAVNDQTDIYTRLIGRGSTHELPTATSRARLGRSSETPMQTRSPSSPTTQPHAEVVPPTTFGSWNDATAGKDRQGKTRTTCSATPTHEGRATNVPIPTQYPTSPIRESRASGSGCSGTTRGPTLRSRMYGLAHLAGPTKWSRGRVTMITTRKAERRRPCCL